MEGRRKKSRVVDVKFLMKTLFDLQVAIAKLAIAIYEKEKATESSARPGASRGPGGAARGLSMPMSESEDNGGYVGDDCDEPPPDSEDQNGWIGDDCDEPPPVPPTCDAETLTKLCEHLDEIKRYLKALCALARG